MKKIPFLIDFFATGFYLGKIPIMPGTFGSLAAIPIGYLGSFLNPLWRIIFAVFLFLLGVFVSTRFTDIAGVEDPGCVVIDEIAALAMLYFLFPFKPFYIVAGFLFFRLFDILKPFPIKYLEGLPKGWGIMTDDVMAVIYAVICCGILSYIIGVTLNESHYHQADLPEGSHLFDNFLGTALGFGIATEKSYIISMPGVPSEMKGMFDKSVTPFIQQKFRPEKPFKIDVHIASIPESEVDAVIVKEKVPSNIECIINAGKGEIVVKIRGLDEKNVKHFSEKIASAFPKNFIGYNGYSLPFALFSLLKEKNITFATAESCTGGLIAKTLTDIPGSSDVFLGSVVSYANSMKEQILGVKSETLNSFGAVSPETAVEMVNGLIKLTDCDYGLSVTGIAGPGGATEAKPVGTVFIGVGSKKKCIVKAYKLRGDREEVRNRTLNAALFQIIAFIKENAVRNL